MSLEWGSGGAASTGGGLTAAQKQKLDGIQTSAEVNPDASEIKVLYESNGNTNAYTDAEKAKLASADVVHYGEPVADLATLSAIPQADIVDRVRHYVTAQTADYFYQANATTGDVAPDDQVSGTGFWIKTNVGGETAAALKSKYESNADTNAYTDAEKAKLASLDDSTAEVSSFNGRSGIVEPAAADYADFYAPAILNNYEATTSPTAGDDASLGYEVGSEWLDTTSGTLFKCVDAAKAAAQWQTGGAVASFNGRTGSIVPLSRDYANYYAPKVVNNFSANRDPSQQDDGSVGYVIGSRWLNTVSGTMFTMTSAAQGVAVWKPSTIESSDSSLPAGLYEGYLSGLALGTGFGQRGNTLEVSCGSAYIEQTGSVLTASFLRSGIPTAAPVGTWYHAYIYNSSGVAGLELSQTGPAQLPFDGYEGRSKDGDSSRRYIGSVVVASRGSNFSGDHAYLLPFQTTGINRIEFINHDTAFTRVASSSGSYYNGSTTLAYRLFALDSVVPAGLAKSVMVRIQNSSTSETAEVSGGYYSAAPTGVILEVPPSSTVVVDVGISPNQNSVFIMKGTITMDVLGYTVIR